jgi:hypothetical protein
MNKKTISNILKIKKEKTKLWILDQIPMTKDESKDSVNEIIW